MNLHEILIDNALSPLFAEQLRKAGHDAIHVRDISLQTASDEEIFEAAENDDRIIVSADTDFGTILALRHKPRPSVIIFRRLGKRRPQQQATLLLVNLPNLKKDLLKGCIAIVEENRIRIRFLPIGGD